MTVLTHIRFGSWLYGTQTPTSDTDYKSVAVPSARDILLQRVQASVSNNRVKAVGEKNVAEDVDDEAYALHRYLEILALGHPVALDMLFAPRWAMSQDPHPLWEEIVVNRHRLLGSRSPAVVTYCRTQANKYGIRGSRVHAVREIIAWLDRAIAHYGHSAKLGAAAGDLAAFLAKAALRHTEIVPVIQGNRAEPVLHLLCSQKMAPYTITLKDTRALFTRVLDQHGQRAAQADLGENVDWKALSHAVRVGHEALELFATAWIEFPLPNAAHILAVKQGRVPYKAVAEEIEDLLDRVEAAQLVSILPGEPDFGFIESLVEQAYRSKVIEHA